MGTYMKNCITVAHKGVCNRESQLYPGNLTVVRLKKSRREVNCYDIVIHSCTQ